MSRDRVDVACRVLVRAGDPQGRVAVPGRVTHE
jgi:hypothetical protein